MQTWPPLPRLPSWCSIFKVKSLQLIWGPATIDILIDILIWYTDFQSSSELRRRICRGYPAKMALTAMLTHGRYGPFGRIPSMCSWAHNLRQTEGRYNTLPNTASYTKVSHQYNRYCIIGNSYWFPPGGLLDSLTKKLYQVYIHDAFQSDLI